MDLSEPGSEAKSIASCLQVRGPQNNSDEVDAGPSSFGHNNNGDQTSSVLDSLTSELSNLSLLERSRALEDLHCVGKGLMDEENYETMSQSLEEFDGIMKQGNYSIYDLAAQQNSAYVEDTSYRLVFLRANLYDVPKAVDQMVNHLHQKARLFGEDTLGRNIALDDLSSEEIEILTSGTFHIQAEADPIGRTVVCCMGHLLGRRRLDMVLRAHYYIMFNVLLQVEAVQLKGVVLVYYDRSEQIGYGTLATSLNELMAMKAYRKSVPVIYSGIHVCLQRTGKPWNERVFVLGLELLTQYSRARTRVHYGSDMEVQYSLRGYGIRLGSFPVDTDGNMRTEILHTWFLKHLNEEGRDLGNANSFCGVAINDLSPTVRGSKNQVGNAFGAEGEFPSDRMTVQPLQHDILLGRGVRLMKHPGNVRFREFLEEYQDEYDRAPRNKRRNVSIKVVRALSSQGVRFLERTKDDNWVESPVSEAEQKVGQLFRSRRKLVRKSK